ncbi:DUF1592 domain-containing protein [Coraliomargarita akajimensis]|uniref:Cytochrome c domain-containing protein n=1 Tax=Coraliomargarita akajimensis (strain DSM 45221 / IAM 15411 / JCM 23193 / KCTC 12865 / 04OKA010-24) TaxID=583355 RepID=D5EJI0_CORAD|nr:DUF1592 domain-containing protein [Coraliomargarita akajimensis]ADE54579.1 Protein of unknown function DUF1592 [Coraliomargarita akajimensis DSM 45221]
MRRLLPSLLLAALSSLVLSASESGAAYTWNDADNAFNRYCFECHGGYATDADLDLINLDHRADLADHPEQWMKILHALRTHYMPHPDGPEMAANARNALSDLIRAELFEQAAGYDAQSASLRRLNRTEYSKTLNDLFLLNEDWRAALPADDAGYGFDNIAAVLSVSPLLLERYFDVASQAAQIAIPQQMLPAHWSISAASFSGAHTSGNSRKVIASAGPKSAAHHQLYFPSTGRYDCTLHLSAHQAGTENARAELYFNGQRIGEYEVQAGRKASPDEFEFSLQVTRPGSHRLEVRFVNDFYKKVGDSKQDRNLVFHQLELHGPHQSADDLRSDFLNRHFPDSLESLSPKALRHGIHRFASRAYRRPATATEVDALWEVFESNASTSGTATPREGLRAVIDAVLVSPAFLFRFEASDANPSEREFALASWLSYFLWSSMPDDQLFQLAGKGQLSERLDSELARMLADPKANALADNFAGQWWRIRDLEIHQPDRSIYKQANKALLDDMHEETRRFFRHVLNQDRSVLDFLTADYTFINARLAKHYGITGVQGTEFQKVSLQQTPRRGVWTQGGILTVTSYPNYTSPVLRGQWILENLIDLAPPPPPDNVPSLPGTEGKPEAVDLRASLALHRENSDCASCHDIMDPFGLSLEHFNAVGGLRSFEERKLLEKETLFDGTVIRDPIDLAKYFETERSDDFVRTVARKLAIYAAGRGLDWQDEAAIERIAQYTREHDDRFSALIQAVVLEFAPSAEPITLSGVDIAPKPN